MCRIQSLAKILHRGSKIDAPDSQPMRFCVDSGALSKHSKCPARNSQRKKAHNFETSSNCQKGFPVIGGCSPLGCC